MNDTIHNTTNPTIQHTAKHTAKLKYTRVSLSVEAQQYAPDLGLEDGFELYTKVVTNGWITPEHLIQIEKPDGTIVCPFIRNRRGIIFLREGDYIITEHDNQRHVCGADKFSERFIPMEEAE